jgi:ubiquinone/menaquinone biosynthesis C-methylase UbiE
VAAATSGGEGTLIKKYFNAKAARWDETVAEKDTDKLEGMARRLKIESGSTVLDVGTGTGVFVPFLLSRIGQSGKLVCLDFAEEMLKRAQAKGFQKNVEYVCGDIAGTGFIDETFDAVVCYSSFPHFQDKPKALREISRVLKKGGRLFICHTSSRAEINETHRQIPEVRNDFIPAEDEMRHLLLAAGFAEVSIYDNKDNYLIRVRKV